MRMSTEPATDYRLWVQIRKIENSYRFVGDMYLGLVKEIKAVNPAFAPDPDVPSFGTDPIGPKPPCVPPLCFRTISELREFTNGLALYAVAISDAIDLVFDAAHELGLESIHFQPTQLPVQPEGTSLEEVEQPQ